MHQSGSSLFTSILREHGMSLGPFELAGAFPSNPHGHFEAWPIMHLSQDVQSLACGFAQYVPASPEILARFLGSQGIWEDRTEIPEDLVERGRELILRLVESGPISGFKDPRTVLIWPFWRRVLEAFPEVRILPIVLLRTPHEIAMSLFARSRSAHGYANCLDVTAVHLRRLAAIVDGWPEPVARVRFGGPHYEEELAQAVASCGLDWDPEKARRCFDATCVHHTSAVVAHDSQRLHDALSGSDDATTVDPIRNLAIVEADASSRESLYREVAQQDREQIDDLRRRAEDLQSSLMRAEETSRSFCNNCQEAQRNWQEAQRNRQEAQHNWQEVARQLEAAREESAKHRGRWEEARELALGLSRQLDAVRVESVHLQTRLLRFDSHPLLGPILRGRRRAKNVLNGLRNRGGDH
jgi:hypothetical protein